eukprot:Nitzschia sp. Nitz4//scaffold9_size221794//162741//163208//NITZ4_001369-RA/size221794-processed-gene-0.341-mRNA-1//-1//CDS//3329561070//1883//frame0
MQFSKDILLYTAFTVDALNTFCTFPLFVIKGSKFALQSLAPDATEEEPNDPKAVASLADTERKSFQLLWDLFMISYEGYTGFTLSTLLCVYNVPETVPYVAYPLFGLYLYKLKVLLQWREDQPEDPQRKAKIYSILGFFLPCYGGYCAWHLLEKL